MSKIEAGAWVIVEAAFGKKLRRRVVEDRGDVVVITSDEEYEDARKNNREPSCVGFRREWVTEEKSGKD